MARLLGGAVAVALILCVALAVFFLYHQWQKKRLAVDSDWTDSGPSQKLEHPHDRQSHLEPEDIQILHLDPRKQQLQQEEEKLQKLPLQTSYYDLGDSPSFCPLDCGLKDTDVHYSELDTSTLEPVPGPQTTVLGSGEVVEYATILLSPPSA